MEDALAAIAAYAPAAMAYEGTPGLSVAITDRTHTLKIITLGYANVDAKTPVTPDTRFAIGSITKSMTAMSLMQLHDAGKLDLDARVQTYLPWFSIRSGGKPILVHELLSHTAGLPDDFSSEPGYLYDVVALRAAKTIFPPGTSWSYSNDGYATAGEILAQLDGRWWSDSLQARVFDPLGMTSSSPVFTPQLMQNAAVGYQWRDNDVAPSPLHPPLAPAPPLDFVDPAGSVLSTPEDMARYMRFYLNGGKTAAGTQLLSASSFALMTNPDKLADGKPAGSATTVLSEAPSFYRQYGFGLAIFNENGDRLVGHTGGISGYTACMQMNLTRGFGAIGFANLVEAPLHPCAIVLYAMQVLRAQSAGRPLPSPPPAPDPLHVAGAASYAGTYASASARALTVVANGDRLTMNDGSATIALYPMGPDVFWVDDPRYKTFLLAFHRDAAHRVTDLNYGSQWYANAEYRGPRTFSYPSSWNALTGRYENTFDGMPDVTRIVIVKNRLTFDGVEPLQALPNGTFTDGESTVRFDAYAGRQPQRLTVDDTRLYRVELP